MTMSRRDALRLAGLGAGVTGRRRAPAQTEHPRHPGRRSRLLRPRLLRRRDPHAEPRQAGRGRPALHAVLQLGALLPFARQHPDGALSAPGGRGRHDPRRKPARLPRPPGGQLRHHSRSAQARRLPHAHGGQVAPFEARADGARLRRILRHAARVRQLLGRQQVHAAAAGPSDAPVSRRRFLRHQRHHRPRARFPGRRAASPASPSSCTWPTTRRISRCTRPRTKSAKYVPVYERGWDAIREARYRRMKEMKLLDARWPLSPRSIVPPTRFADQTAGATS